MSDGGTLNATRFSQSDSKTYNFREEQGRRRAAEKAVPHERREWCTVATSVAHRGGGIFGKYPEMT